VRFANSVRAAAPRDAAAVAEIYNEGIRGRTATFETTERAPDDILDWFNPSYPFLVAVCAEPATSDTVCGWVRASKYRDRDCYAGIGEFSVYVAGHARGKRIGDALMAAFVPACESAGLWKLVSRIFPENIASRALCARHGFREVGTYEKHAQLDGVWRDVVIVERSLSGIR
jgi:L-amino acid N-acyltransferase YncA